ncbi:small EDRK-rich factor 1 isoform X1 [Engystomops pustulosus]|uniref:small EDRK-rich factor 1 isoform X1 n=1 Tax=Engystomops pustulosus TaxID=76066 RepID=UPI003AFB4691
MVVRSRLMRGEAAVIVGLCVFLRAIVYHLRWGILYSVGGNQRELARQKNLKKNQDLNKGKRKDDALSAAQRKQRDSEIMQLKQKAANEKKSVQTGSV